MKYTRYPDCHNIASYWTKATYDDFHTAKNYAQLFIGSIIHKIPETWSGKPYFYNGEDIIEIREEN